MPDDRTVKQAMREMGVSVAEVAKFAGVDRSYASRQLGGDIPMQETVKVALLEALRARAIASLPQVEGLLLELGEAEAAEACERVWVRLGRPGEQPGSCESS